jgi:hypothetical protein
MQAPQSQGWATLPPIVIFIVHGCLRWHLAGAESVAECETRGFWLVSVHVVFMPVLRPLPEGFHASPVLLEGCTLHLG